MTTTIKLTLRIALVALLLAALAATLLLRHPGGAAADPTPATPPAQFLPDPGSTADAADTFAVLDRAAAPADLSHNALDIFGAENDWADVDGSRLVARLDDGDVWLTPTDDGRVCLSVASGATTATSCDTLARAATIGVVLETAGRYIGILPDGTTAATLARAGGSGAEDLDAGGAVYAVDAGPGALTVTSGAGEFQLPVR
jgi:hypothetical protein